MKRGLQCAAHSGFAFPQRRAVVCGRAAGTIEASPLTPQEPARKTIGRPASYGRKLGVDALSISRGESIFVGGTSSGVSQFTPGESIPEVLSQPEGSVAPASPLYTGAIVDPSQVAMHHFRYGIALDRVGIESDGRDFPAIDAASLIASGKPRLALIGRRMRVARKSAEAIT